MSVGQINIPNGPKPTNKFAYKLIIENPLIDKKSHPCKYYISLAKLDFSAVVIDFKGFLVDEKQFDAINSYEDALNIAENKEIMNLMIPWQKVISIENILYKQRFSAKGEK